MLHVLAYPTYRPLFIAQVVALIGTGLATVALGLLASRPCGRECGRGSRHDTRHNNFNCAPIYPQLSQHNEKHEQLRGELRIILYHRHGPLRRRWLRVR